MRNEADKRNQLPVNVIKSLLLCSSFKHVSTDISTTFVPSIFLSLSSSCPINSPRSYSMLTYPRKQNIGCVPLSFAVLPELERNWKN